MVRPRRILAVALVFTAVAVIALSVVSAADVGYHFDQGALMLPDQHQGHVYLHMLGDPPELGISVGLGMLMAAGYFVVAKDGTTWEVRFDPHTLRPANPVDRCTDAPDPVGAD